MITLLANCGNCEQSRLLTATQFNTRPDVDCSPTPTKFPLTTHFQLLLIYNAFKREEGGFHRGRLEQIIQVEQQPLQRHVQKIQTTLRASSKAFELPYSHGS